jgi:hypothetical protein
MSGYDIFAWIVLIILIASTIGVFCIAGWLPGHIAKTRGHPKLGTAEKTFAACIWRKLSWDDLNIFGRPRWVACARLSF